MRIAIVHSHIEARIEGWIVLIDLAKILSEQNEVDVVLYEIPQSVEGRIRTGIGKAHLRFIKYGEPRGGLIHILKFEVSGLVDLILFNRLRRTDYDAILVVSSAEAWWLAFFYHIFGMRKRTVVGLAPTDPPRGVDLKFYLDHKRPNMRELKSWLFMRMQHFRLKFFDIVFGQSKWTNEIFRYYYDINVVGLSGAFDDSIFEFKSIQNSGDPYIAVPTVSLDSDRVAIIKQLELDGINMKIFGRKRTGMANELGYVTTEALIDILRGAAATLFLFDYESLGLIPFESLALGTPVITERKLGPYSDLRDNKYVTFINTDDYKSILSACKYYLNKNTPLEEKEQISKSVRDRTYANYAKIIYDNVEILSRIRRKIS